VFAGGILSSQPYTFLDDAPLEERRTQAVMRRRGGLDARGLDSIGELDPEAVARVRDEAWPRPEDPEEVHEVLMWMGYVTAAESGPWRTWLDDLHDRKRVVLEGDRWYAAEAPRDPRAVLRGRLEALGPIVMDDPMLLELERQGVVLRVRLQGQDAWCERRLLARIHRYTLDRLRKEIEPVSAADFLAFLSCWQHVDEHHMVEGPAGVLEVLRQLAGFEAPAATWESSILPRRVRGYKREWLDQATLSGEFAWGRLWGSGACAVRVAPIGFYARTDLPAWLGLTETLPPLTDGYAGQVASALQMRGAAFPQELAAATRLLPTQIEAGLAELVGRGLVTCDSFAALRGLIVPPSRRTRSAPVVGRWSLLRRDPIAAPLDLVVRQLLRRTGVVFRKTVERERVGVPWWRLVRELRTLEARGDVRGGRFVAGFDGEQYALPEAITLLRAVRRRGGTIAEVPPSDPLYYRGVLTPGATEALTA
jgi:ATP-dependent Lhr-like helicase